MMQSKAQAGMEYLVTYGWLLIFIVTIASVFFFVFTPKSTQFRCTADQGEKFLLKGYNIPEKYHYSSPEDYWYDNGSATEPIEISLQNNSGEKIKITKIECFAKGKFVECASDANGNGYFSNLNNKAKINGTKFTGITAQQVSVEKNEKILLQSFAIIYRPSAGFFPPGKFRFSYLDGTEAEKKFTISCEGYPSKLSEN